MVYLLNRVRTSVSGTPGTGTISLGSAVAGFQGFSAAGATDGYTYAYLLEDGNNWEVGIGTWGFSGNTLARTTVIQSSAGGTTPITASSNTIVSVTMISNDGPLSVKIGQLDDVITSAPQMGQTLAWNGSDWVNGSPGILGVPPTQANTGLSTWINQGTVPHATSVIGSAIGISLQNPGNGGGRPGISALITPVPATPYTVTALISITANSGYYAGGGIGWYDGSSKFHTINNVFNNGSGLPYQEIEEWTSSTSFDTAPNTFGQAQAYQVWLGIGDDGTNVEFSVSNDGVNFYLITSGSKSSEFLGGSGYNYLAFVLNQSNNFTAVTLLSWNVAP